jgi:hypothetical protein
MENFTVSITHSRNVSKELHDQIYKARMEDEMNAELYTEQIICIREKKGYLVTLMDQDIYLGGTMVYTDTDDMCSAVCLEVPSMQGIVKRKLPGYQFRLNSLLLPKIIDFLREKGFNRLWVEPYEKQGEILIKYFGFKWECYGTMYLDF